MATNNIVNAATTGIQSRTSTGVWNGRTLTGTSNQISVANGTGASANPTFSLPAFVVNNLKPCFVSYLSGNLTDVTGDGTQYNIVFDSTLVNQNSNFSTVTGKFNPPVTGKYCFISTITLSGALVGNTAAFPRHVDETGVIYRGMTINPFVASIGGVMTITHSAVVALTAGTLMRSQLIVSNGTKVIDILAGTSSAPLTTFSGFLIC